MIFVVVGFLVPIVWQLGKKVWERFPRQQRRVATRDAVWETTRRIDYATERAMAAMMLAVKVQRWHDENDGGGV